MEYLSPSYYSRSAMANNQFNDCEVNDTLTGKDVLVEKHAIGLGLWGSIGALMGLSVLFYIIANIVFYFNVKKKLRKIQI